MTPSERERNDLLLLQMQRDGADPFAKLLLEIDALRQGLPEESTEHKHLTFALKHVLVCKYGLKNYVKEIDMRAPVMGHDPMKYHE